MNSLHRTTQNRIPATTAVTSQVRVALTITELEPGGAEQCLAQLATFLHRQGHHVVVVTLGHTPQRSLGGSPDRNALRRWLATQSIPVKSGNATSLPSLFKTVAWLRQELRDFKPDIVQSMLFHANVVTAAANNGLSSLLIGGERVKQVGWMRGHLTRWASRRMSKVVCVSQSVADDCQRRLRIPSEKLVVIPNGIETENTPAEFTCELPFGSDAPLLLFAGRLSEQKGILQLLQMAQQLLSKLPAHHLVILGDGPLKARVQQIVADQPIGSRIHVLGWQPNVRQWMQRSELILVPSLYEGMPNVVLEAMSQSRPVVCFDVEGVRELLADGAAQQIARAADWSEFIHAAQQIVSDRELASRLGQANFSRVQQEFRLTDQLLKYERLYLNAIERQN